MATIYHKIGIKADIETVYEKLTTLEGLSGWWTKTTGVSEAGKKLVFEFGEHKSTMIVVDLKKPNLVHWKVDDSGTDRFGTEILFNLKADDKQTFVNFQHRGWDEDADWLAHCSTKWAVFLLSLKDLIEKGTGQPFPNDVQIDWN